MPSCATLASSALRRCFIEVRSCRCHTQRTPAGEIDSPRRFSISETRTWPQAGCPIANSTTACSISGAVRFFNTGLRPTNFLQRQFATFIVQILETVKAVAAVAHHLAGLADIAELLGKLQQANLCSDDLLLLRHIAISVPPEGGSRSQLGVRTAPRPPAPLRKPTPSVRLSPSYYSLSTPAPLRALRPRTPDPAWSWPVVGEGVTSCPRADAGNPPVRFDERDVETEPRSSQ